MKFKDFRNFIYGKMLTLTKNGDGRYYIKKDLTPLDKLLPKGKVYDENEGLKYIYANLDSNFDKLMDILYSK